MTFYESVAELLEILVAHYPELGEVPSRLPEAPGCLICILDGTTRRLQARVALSAAGELAPLWF